MNSPTLRDQIPLQAKEACLRLIRELRALGIRKLKCPRDTLIRLHRFTEDPDKLIHPSFLRIQDYLSRVLSKDEDDDSWGRARWLEGLLAGLMGGEAVGNRTVRYKADILGPDDSVISLKTHSGTEPMVCAGNLLGITGDDFRQSIIMWNQLFVTGKDSDFPLLKRPSGKILRFRRKPLADLKQMSRGSKKWKNIYKNHQARRRQWRRMLQRTYRDLDSWIIFYISENMPNFRGEVTIHWFSNNGIIDFLSPIDRPPPIVISSDHTSNFRFNANSLKEEIPTLKGPYLSGSIFLEKLLSSSHPEVEEILRIRNKLCEGIEHATPARLEELSKIL